MLSVGNVVEVWVPDDGCEAARDLSRALDDAREDLKRCKQRLSKFLLRHGYVFSETTPTGRRKGNWTAAHWAWIKSISFPEKADDDVLAYYVDAVRRAMEDRARLERLVEAEASKPRWKRRIDSIRCLNVSVNIFFTIFTNAFSPIAPTRIRRIRQRGCAAFGV